MPADGRRTVYFNGEAAVRSRAGRRWPPAPVWFTVELDAADPRRARDVVARRGPGTKATPRRQHDERRVVGRPRRPPRRSRRATRPTCSSATRPRRAGQVRLTLIPDTGVASTRELPIAAGERLTVNVGNAVRADRGALQRHRRQPRATPGAARRGLRAVSIGERRAVLGRRRGAGRSRCAGLGDTAPSVTATTPGGERDGRRGRRQPDGDVQRAGERAAPGAFVLACPAGTPIALTTLTVARRRRSRSTRRPTCRSHRAARCAVVASQITDADTIDPPDTLAADVDGAVHDVHLRGDHGEPDDGAGRHANVAVRAGDLHADRRDARRSRGPSPPARCRPGSSLSTSRRARRDADRVGIVQRSP